LNVTPRVIGNATLHLGDCLELMKEIPDASVDLILCDLPYGTTRNKWDSVIPLDELWAAYKRICRGAIVLTAQTPFDKVLGASNIDMLRYEWIWRKEAGTGFLNAKRAPLKDHENILVFYRQPPSYQPQMRTGFKPYRCKKGGETSNYNKSGIVTTESDGERYPVTVIDFPRDKLKLHPTQKPVALMEYLIRTYTNEGDTVLDNCMGSGTTGVACMNTGRIFIGMEKLPEYFGISCQRIERAVAPTLLAQPDLLELAEA
jgi:DNA modification methylase